MEPRAFTDGHIRTPTAIMLKAGKLIMNLLTIAEQDRAGRMKAEQTINVLSGEIFQLRTASDQEATFKEAVTAYRNVMNEEYAREFT